MITTPVRVKYFKVTILIFRIIVSATIKSLPLKWNRAELGILLPYIRIQITQGIGAQLPGRDGQIFVMATTIPRLH